MHKNSEKNEPQNKRISSMNRTSSSPIASVWSRNFEPWKSHKPKKPRLCCRLAFVLFTAICWDRHGTCCCVRVRMILCAFPCQFHWMFRFNDSRRRKHKKPFDPVAPYQNDVMESLVCVCAHYHPSVICLFFLSFGWSIATKSSKSTFPKSPKM